MSQTELKEMLSPLPLIAILRGIKPEEIETIVGTLIDVGFTSVEVPLNSPQPFESIQAASRAFGNDILVGAGTVTSDADVQRVNDAGGQFIVSPNTDLAVIKKTKSLNMYSFPGVSTPSEAFSALSAGADMLKLFPAEAIEPKVVKAWRAVLPKEVWLIPVGGIGPDNMQAYLQAGANGFGLGSALYRATDTAETVKANAMKYFNAFKLQK